MSGSCIFASVLLNCILVRKLLFCLRYKWAALDRWERVSLEQESRHRCATWLAAGFGLEAGGVDAGCSEKTVDVGAM